MNVDLLYRVASAISTGNELMGIWGLGWMAVGFVVHAFLGLFISVFVIEGYLGGVKAPKGVTCSEVGTPLVLRVTERLLGYAATQCGVAKNSTGDRNQYDCDPIEPTEIGIEKTGSIMQNFSMLCLIWGLGWMAVGFVVHVCCGFKWIMIVGSCLIFLGLFISVFLSSPDAWRSRSRTIGIKKGLS